MVLYALAFLAGDLLLQYFSKLPSSIYMMSVLICFLIIYWILPVRRKWAAIAILFLCGFAMGQWRATETLSWQLPLDREDVPMQVTGHIDSIPIADEKRVAFNLKLQHSHAVLKLYWLGKRDLRVGDEWHLAVKVKRVHDIKNPGSFDYQSWALQNGIRAEGSVLKEGNYLIARHWYYYPVATLRQYVRSQILRILPHTSTSPWLVALIMGERSNINPESWQVLKNTGTNHLMAIAGLHIGFISGFISMFVSWCWRFHPRASLFIPAHKAGSYFALAGAIFYSMLSGFLVPAERACLMLTAFILSNATQRFIPAWHVWSLALISVLLINPLSILTESFWLSFGTLAIIIYGMEGRLQPEGVWWKYFRVQWVIGFGLIPLSLFFFQQISLVSFLANSIAIPWLGFLVLPFCVLAGLTVSSSTVLAQIPLFIADKSLSWLWCILDWFANLSIATWTHAIVNEYQLLVVCSAFIFFLLPIGMPGRWLGVVWLLPIFFTQPEKPAPNDFWLTMLDVGQGLSVLVQTNQHTLIFDAGPRVSAQMDAGEHIILPYLNIAGITSIDKLIVSHGDNDHIGGAAAIYNALPVRSVLTSVPEKLAAMHAAYCLSGYSWQWDGVRFEFLYPSFSDLGTNNDSSCVLKIENGSHSVLLTGDIEKLAEYKLLQTHKAELSAEILVAPHHGSKTSAEPDFVNAVHPRYVLYATGYRNRYHFPHQPVIAAYQQIGALAFDTSPLGLVQLKLPAARAIPEPYLYRVAHARYWY